MPQITRPRFGGRTALIQSGFAIRLGLMRVPQQLPSPHSTPPSRRLRLGHKASPVGPSLDQRSIHREVFVTQQPRLPCLLYHSCQKLLRHFSPKQSLPVLGKYGYIPHLIIHLQPYEPAEQQVVVHLFHQQTLAPPPVQYLQQQGSQQSLRRDRRPPARRIQTVELPGNFVQRCIRHRPNPPQRMIPRDPLLRVHVAEHHCLLLVISSHVCFYQFALCSVSPNLDPCPVFPQPV